MRASQEGPTPDPALERAILHALRTQVADGSRLPLADLLVAVRWLTQRPDLEAAEIERVATTLIEKHALQVRLHRY